MLSKRLKELRKEKGVAERHVLALGHYKASLYCIRNGQAATGLRDPYQLADYFNVTVDYLLGRTEFRSARAW